MILPSSDQITDMTNDANYQAMFVVGADKAQSLGNSTIPGVEEFETELESFGTQVVTRTSPNCGNKVTCSDAGGTIRGDACIAANKYIELKQNIRDLSTYRCDIFELANGASCDTKDMTSSVVGGQTVWSGGCLL